jgi:hypothetical protein
MVFGFSMNEAYYAEAPSDTILQLMFLGIAQWKRVTVPWSSERAHWNLPRASSYSLLIPMHVVCIALRVAF